MRDLLVTLIVFCGLPYILRQPYIGVLMWSWIGYMNPHQLSWGFAASFPFAQITAITTIVGLAFSRERKDFPITPLTVTWLFFIVWMGFSTVFALYPSESTVQLVKVLKIQLVTFITIMVIRDRNRLLALVAVITASVGFFGIKGGVFSILSGGSYRVWGPPKSFIQDNNELALALLMTLPLMLYLRQQVANLWMKRGIVLAVFFTAVSVICSYSRGAFLASGAVMVFLWIKSRQKLMVAIVAVVFISVMIAFMPIEWQARMGTIRTYGEDESAMGRIAAWKLAIIVASHRVFGGGFSFWSQDAFSRYSDLDYGVHVAHSVYFSVLGEHGWPGLLMFVAIGIIAFRQGSWVIRNCRGRDDLIWIADLVRMLQVSLIAYATGGAFLSLSYFDMYWHFVAILVISKRYVQEKLNVPPNAVQTSPRRGSSVLPATTFKL